MLEKTIQFSWWGQPSICAPPPPSMYGPVLACKLSYFVSLPACKDGCTCIGGARVVIFLGILVGLVPYPISDKK